MQTGKSDLHPVVLLEEPGSNFWSEWLRFLEKELVGRGLISAEDLFLICHANSIEAAVEELTRFYRNYQSQRYVDGMLVLRTLRLPPEDEIERLAAAFSDILGPRGMQVAEASPAEIADGDQLDCKRLSLDFNQTSVGRLRRLIDELNRF
jgi:hypothetical protein